MFGCAQTVADCWVDRLQETDLVVKRQAVGAGDGKTRALVPAGRHPHRNLRHVQAKGCGTDAHCLQPRQQLPQVVALTCAALL